MSYSVDIHRVKHVSDAVSSEVQSLLNSCRLDGREPSTPTNVFVAANGTTHKIVFVVQLCKPGLAR